MYRKIFAAVALCVSFAASAAGYTTQNGKIYDPSGAPVQVRGISHFGFNDGILQPEYLWSMGWKDQIAQIKALGFNAVRLPFVPDTLYNTTPVDKLSYVDPNKNADLIGKTPLQVMDMWMAEPDRQGLYVMMDMHSVSKVRQYPTWFVDNSSDYNLVYNNQAYTAANWIRDLKFVAQRYANLPHFFGIDIYNEPNGAVRWSTGDPNQTNSAYFWKAAAESAASAILSVNPNLLIMVQGIAGNYDGVEDSSIPMNWGEDFQPQAYQPLNIPANKLVLVPHTYGPDVYMKPTFGAANYPANLPQYWDALFGKFYPAHPIVTGEWGGKYGTGTGGQSDVTWQNAFVQYLISKGIRDGFYWCYTPNSGDTGGILDDNLNVRQDKMALLRQLWGGSAVGLSSSSYGVAQSGGSLTVSVNRTGGSTGAATVQYATADGTAKAGSDYTAKSGSLSWADGDATAKSFAVAISNASPYQGTKSFALNLSNASGAVMSTSSATATITGSAAATPGSVAWTTSSATINQTAGSITVTVARSAGSSGAVGVSYATADGTAHAGTDYTAASGTLSWAAGDATAKSFAIAVSGATPFSGTRNFSVKLASPTGGAALGTPSAETITINGTTSGVFRLSAASYTVAQNGGSLKVTVSRGSGTQNAVSVRYTTVDGTAKSGTDYTAKSGTLSWNAGDATAKTFLVPISNATPFSGTKSFSVNINSPTGGAQLGGPNTATVTISGSKASTSSSTSSSASPYITSWSPTSGKAGTVVTINGTGFTGVSVAWAGSAHDATVSVVNDTQVKVTIPADATTGAIGINNPQGWAFTPSSFTVTN